MIMPIAQLLSAHASGSGGLEFDSRVGQIGTESPTARHRCDVSLELCSLSAKPRRRAPPLVTREIGNRPATRSKCLGGQKYFRGA